MTEENKGFEPASRQGSLIESLREQPNFLMERYNQQLKTENEQKGVRRAGGVYVPPHKLRQLQQEMLEEDPASEGHQRMMWELLRKSINGIVNKVNIANIQNIVVELFNENILRGRGMLARALIKAQMASPNFTHVYAALIAVINTKVPEIGLLVAKRVLIQFRRSFERNNKIVCVATTRMLAHLVNQRVIGEFVALQMLMILLSSPTEDSVEIACDFMVEVGQVLGELTPVGANAIFQRFKGLLHEAEVGQKAQYSIENLFAIRKTGFKSHPGVIPELDLVQFEDQITHQLDIQEELKGEETLNIFRFDPRYEQTEAEWDAVKQEILGEENLARLKQPDAIEEEYDAPPAEEGIQDLTEQDLVNLRKTIYLAIQSTVNFEQCAHKILKMNIAKGYEHELVDMILECCMMERIYQSFFGLLAERFCTYEDKFKDLFERAFLSHYNNIFNQEANKIRNLGHLFGHLFHRRAVDWAILQPIRLSPEATTAAARMFLKILLRDIAENMGADNLAKQFQKEDMKEYYQGLFPMDNMSDLRFAINYYTTIGLGQLTEEMREVLTLHEEIINERKRKEEEAQAQILLREEEEMMKMIMEEQAIKQEQEKKVKEEKRSRIRDREEDDREQRRRGRDRDSRDRYDRDDRRERHQRRETEDRLLWRDETEQDRKPRRKYRGDSQEEPPVRLRSKSRSISPSEQKRMQEKARERKKQVDRHRQKEDERRERERQREREKERERDEKEKEREKQKERQKQKQREREREKEKEKQREREKEKQKERQLEKQKEKEKEKEKQKEKEERQKERAKEVEQQKRQKESKLKQQRNRSRSRQNRKRKQRSPSSSSSSSSSRAKKKTRKPETKRKADPKKAATKKRESSSDSSSSGLSSSSSSSSKVVAKPTKPVAVKKPKSGSSSGSSSSSSESSVESNEPKRNRIDSSESS